jgi:hypothetical protein
MIKTFTNNLEATAYGYAMGVLALTETDSQAEIRIVAVSAETDSRVKLIVKYDGGDKILGQSYRDEDTGIMMPEELEPIELTTFHYIDMDSIDLSVEAEKLSEFFEGLKFDEEYDGSDDGDYS